MKMRMVRWFGLGLLCISLLGGCDRQLASSGPALTTQSAEAQIIAQKTSGSAAAALTRLMQGNQRYVAMNLMRPNQTMERRLQVSQAQHPSAIVLTCADSRVPPELVFDQGLGDLFVVRVAGNVLDDHVAGSIEYAAEHLGAPLVLVLGHERCGAVEAAVHGGEAPGKIQSLIEAIRPAVKAAQQQPGDLLDNSVKENAKRVVQQLEHADPLLSHLIEAGKLEIVGARYDLDSGKVELLP